MGEKGQTVSRGWGNGNIIYEVDSDRYQDKHTTKWENGQTNVLRN